MDLAYHHTQLYSSSSLHINDPYTSPLGSFPFHKTKLKSARKHLEESHNSSFTNFVNEKELNSGTFEAKYVPNNINTFDKMEKSLDLTPSREGINGKMNFNETIKSPHENRADTETNKRMQNLEKALNDQIEENQKFRGLIEEHRNNERKLKEHVQSLLDVNSKLSAKIHQPHQENVGTSVERLQQQLQECNDEKDYLNDKIMTLNQKVDTLLKKDVYKEKMIDFYKNRIKLYQFKLENYPKSEKEQIKCLEDYVMAILGENSKLNKALEKSESESKKWQEKYFEFEKSREVLLTKDYTMKDQINNISQKTYHPNNIHEKEINTSGKKEESLFWSCRPKK